jgi:hypothetical protein
MPRRLSDDRNELILQDNISGGQIALYYRMPTTTERVAFANESIRRMASRIELKRGEMRLKYGAAILDGIREGDFEVKKNGAYVAIASDPASPNFDPDWKNFVKNHAADLIEILAVHVFENAAQMVSTVPVLDEETDAEGN